MSVFPEPAMHVISARIAPSLADPSYSTVKICGTWSVSSPRRASSAERKERSSTGSWSMPIPESGSTERLAAEDIHARNYLRLLEDGRSDECEEDDLEWRMDASEKPGPIDSSFQDKPLGGFDDDDIPF